MSEHVVVDVQDRVLTIRLNRPEKKNALTFAMYTAMTEALMKAESDAGIRVVLITGTNFQNGATVKFGATPAVSTTFNSSTSLSAVAPAHGSAGAVTLSVTNPDGQSVSAGTYTYFAPPVTGPKRRAVRQHG